MYAWPQPNSSADDVKADQTDEDRRQRIEVDACAGNDRHRTEHVGQLALSGRAQRRFNLGLGRAGGHLCADHAFEDDIGRVTQDLGAEDREGDTANGQNQDDDDAPRLWS